MKKLFFIFALSLTTAINAQNTVSINGVSWSTENLSVSKFNNGDAIFQAKSDSEWEKACAEKKPACIEVTNALGKKEKLYNFYVLMDKRGILPKGMRFPTGSDFLDVNNFFMSSVDANISSMNLVLSETIFLNSCGEINREKGNSFWYLDEENMPTEAILEMNAGPCMSISVCQEDKFPLCDDIFLGFSGGLAPIGMAQLGNGMLIRLIKQ
jgi:hypothetical protein